MCNSINYRGLFRLKEKYLRIPVVRRRLSIDCSDDYIVGRYIGSHFRSVATFSKYEDAKKMSESLNNGVVLHLAVSLSKL